MTDNKSWDQEDAWWRDNFSTRPYGAGRQYEELRPAYRFGYDSANHHLGREWNDVENDLRTGWDKSEGKGPSGSTWENVKDAVKDAWHRMTGQRDVDTNTAADFERQRQAGGVGSFGDKP